MLALIALAMDQSAYDWHHIGVCVHVQSLAVLCNFSPIVFVAVMVNGMDVSLPFLALTE